MPLTQQEGQTNPADRVYNGFLEAAGGHNQSKNRGYASTGRAELSAVSFQPSAKKLGVVIRIAWTKMKTSSESAVLVANAHSLRLR